MFGFGMQELLVILAIVLLIFGPKRLKNIGADLGNAIKVPRRYLMRVKRQKTMTLQQKSLTAMVRPPRRNSPPPRPTKKRNKSAARLGWISNLPYTRERNATCLAVWS